MADLVEVFVLILQPLDDLVLRLGLGRFSHSGKNQHALIVIPVIKWISFHGLVDIMKGRFDVTQTELQRTTGGECLRIVRRKRQCPIEQCRRGPQVSHFQSVLSRDQVAQRVVGFSCQIPMIFGSGFGMAAVESQLLSQSETCTVKQWIAPSAA